METKKGLYVIHLKGELYGQDAYYYKKENYFFKSIRGTIFDSEDSAIKILESNKLKQAKDKFCNENGWSTSKLDIISYGHNTEQKDYNVSFSEGELYFLDEVMYNLRYNLSGYGKDAPFFAKVYPSVSKKIKSLFIKSQKEN